MNSMKNRLLIFYILAFAAITICILLLTQFTGLNHDFSDVITYTRVAYIVIDILILLKILHIIIRSDFRELIKKIALAIISLLTLGFILEGIFMFVPYSHGAGGKESLAARIWFYKYWNVNSLGYRDKEVDTENGKDKFNIMIVGDSFVAGHGIKDPSKRFSDLLQKRMSNSYQVYNLGLNGADTQVEYNQLVQFPIKPNLIILAHHPNDIERVPRTSTNLGSSASALRTLYASLLPLSIQKSLIQNSYFLNYFFWKFNPISTLDKEVSIAGKAYFESAAGQDQHLASYLNKDMFTQHLKDIYQFVLLSREESIPLVVLLFPETWDETIEFSETYANQPIEAFLQREGIAVLDVYPTIKEVPVVERIVNNNDAHLSELAHHKIADVLHDFLVKSKLIN